MTLIHIKMEEKKTWLEKLIKHFSWANYGLFISSMVSVASVVLFLFALNSFIDKNYNFQRKEYIIKGKVGFYYDSKRRKLGTGSNSFSYYVKMDFNDGEIVLNSDCTGLKENFCKKYGLRKWFYLQNAEVLYIPKFLDTERGLEGYYSGFGIIKSVKADDFYFENKWAICLFFYMIFEYFFHIFFISYSFFHFIGSFWRCKVILIGR